jgi:hypothetical protein
MESIHALKHSNVSRQHKPPRAQRNCSFRDIKLLYLCGIPLAWCLLLSE